MYSPSLAKSSLGSHPCDRITHQLLIFRRDTRGKGVVCSSCFQRYKLQDATPIIVKTFPFFVMALGHVPRKTKKQGLGSVLSSLTFLGAEVSEDDWVYADEHGVVISKTEECC
ncbi:hypothetical protein C1E24_04155 [Pseudoalteromonas phenolica]|uniref:Uncharacterized protein n=1 Tax=Pseudoalteromonas phenolica TaxID=161398 RepID=A0A5R9Q4C6_9GAMM|nr:hypothetical protein C1E24_04155 [Pseudoalteromonas phenolica]